MERKIGDTFEFEGKKIEVRAASRGCDGCFLKEKCCIDSAELVGICGAGDRTDKKHVVFVEVQEQPQKAEQPQETEEGRERRIGEVFEYEGKKLKVVEGENECDKCYFYNKIYCTRIDRIAGACLMSRRIDNKSVRFVEVTEEHETQQAEQPQKLNLCEILKYCPQRETFWSPMLNSVKFSDIDDERQMIIVETVEGHFTWEINHDGTISIDEVTSPEVMLFPSKEQRDWTTVKYEPKKELPRTWEEFCEQNPIVKLEYFIDHSSYVRQAKIEGGIRHKEYDRNPLPSKQAAEAHLALMQLHQLRDAWREGWVPDWNDGDQNKYVIASNSGEFKIYEYHTISRFLAFQDEKRADEFNDCFIDLIRKAGDLI